jgi:hypothetical protein
MEPGVSVADALPVTGLSLVLAVLIVFLALASGIGLVGAAVFLGRGVAQSYSRRRTRRVGRVATS